MHEEFDNNQEYLNKFFKFLNDHHCDEIFDNMDIVNKSKKLKQYGPAVYIQLRQNGLVYVGETLNLFHRTMRHIECGVRVAYLGAISVWMLEDKERRDLETFLIGDAQMEGFPLANTDKIDEGLTVAGKVRSFEKAILKEHRSR